jgi:hypothetical protein
LTFALYTVSSSPKIKSGALPTDLYTPTFFEDLLSLFCMFDTDGYHPGLSPDINDYSSVVLCVLFGLTTSVTIVYASLITSVVPVRHAYNTDIGPEVQK